MVEVIGSIPILPTKTLFTCCKQGFLIQYPWYCPRFFYLRKVQVTKMDFYGYPYGTTGRTGTSLIST